jgi:hypothetical protein
LYLRFLLICSILLSAVAFWPAVKDAIASLSGSNRSLPVTKPLYRTLPVRLSIASLAVAVGLYFYNWTDKRRRLQRFLALGAATLYNGALIVVYHQLVVEVAFGRVSEQQWPSIQCLRIVEVSDPDPEVFAFREELRLRSDVRTFADFHRCVMEQFAESEAKLRQYWPGGKDMDDHSS